MKLPRRMAMSDKKKYQIKIHSCKKDTKVTYFLSTTEAQLLQNIAVATQLASSSECEPTLFVTPVKKLTVKNGVA